jgi:hypothetical protein
MPGSYGATITVSDPGAVNDPQTIDVTLVIQTVSCDFAPQDGDVDQEDFGHLQACLSQPGAAPAAGCADADLDADHDVDQDDFGIFQQCVSGPNRLADKTCDD